MKFNNTKDAIYNVSYNIFSDNDFSIVYIIAGLISLLLTIFLSITFFGGFSNTDPIVRFLETYLSIFGGNLWMGLFLSSLLSLLVNLAFTTFLYRMHLKTRNKPFIEMKEKYALHNQISLLLFFGGGLVIPFFSFLYIFIIGVLQDINPVSGNVFVKLATRMEEKYAK